MTRKKTEITIVEEDFGTGYTDVELHHAYHGLIESEEDENLLMESLSLEEFDNFYNPGPESFKYTAPDIMEAVTFKHYTALKKGIEKLARAFANSLKGSGSELTTYTEPAQLKPRKSRFFAYVAVEFAFSDGQTVKMMFHSPGGDARTFDKDDVLVSYAFTLNKRDVTHMFAEKRGLTVPGFVKRMSQILLKNSEKFQKRQTNLAETKKRLAEAEAAATDLERQIVMANDATAAVRLENEDARLEIESLKTSIEDAKKEKARLEGLLAEAGQKAATEAPQMAGAEASEPASAVVPETPAEPEAAPPEPAAAAPDFLKLKPWEARLDELPSVDGAAALKRGLENLKQKGFDDEATLTLAAYFGEHEKHKKAYKLMELKKEAEEGLLKLKENPAAFGVSSSVRLDDFSKQLEESFRELREIWDSLWLKLNKEVEHEKMLAAQGTEIVPDVEPAPSAPAEPEAAPDDPVAGVVVSYSAVGDDILSGKLDDQPERIEDWIANIYDFVEANSAHASIGELRTQLDAVSDYYTALLSKAA